MVPDGKQTKAMSQLHLGTLPLDSAIALSNIFKGHTLQSN